jgi:DNA-binding LacI/PurR family transcriptional regulator
MAKSKITSGDVARLARVSQSAVSRSFSKGTSVSDATRAKVFKAATKLGYRPNAIARAMISGKSGLIAILVAYLDNHYYPIVLESMSRKLQEHGFHVLLFMTDGGKQDEVVQQILQYQVEGIVMASATLSSTLAKECADTGIPVVLFNRYVASSPASSVTSDNIDGGRQAARLLADIGHKRIAFIAGNEDSSTNRDREAGFYRGVAESGLTVWSRAIGNYTFEGAAAATRLLFEGKSRPDAVFVANDHMAFAVMDVLRNELKLRVPKDVSVVGYDDVPESDWGGYQLTTIRQPTDKMIDSTVAILVEQIEKKTVTRRAVVHPAELIVRNSSRFAVGKT